MHRFAVLFVASFVAFSASPATANDSKLCFNVDTPPDTGIAACSRLIASKRVKGSSLADAYLLRSEFYNQKKDYDRALADADMRLRLTPVDAMAFRHRAVIWIGKRDYERAMRDVDEAIRLAPKEPSGFDMRAFLHYQKKDYDGAIADYDKAIQLAPKTANYYGGRGNAWLFKGEPKRAIDEQNRAIALDPRNAVHFVNRSLAYREAGELDKALTDAEKASALDPKMVEPYVSRGLIYRAKQDFARSRAAYDRAIAVNPAAPGAWTGRGLLHEATGDIESAKKDFQRALDSASLRVVGHSGGTTYVDVGSIRDHDTARARLAVLAATEGTTSRAQAADSGRRVALVIGNGAYTAAGELPNPARDAAAIARNLKAIGFEVSEGIDLKRADMTRVVGEFLRNATNARIAVLFYAGHGIQIDGKNYLLPVDARIENGAELTADMTDLDTILAGLDDQIRTNIVILDACRDNPTAENVTKVAGVSRSVAVRSGLAAPAGLGKGATLGAGTLLAFATAPGQVALDGDGDNSPFSAALSRHISTPGLEIQQVLTRVRAEVVAATASKQVPWSNSSLLGEVFLVGGKQ